MINFERLISQLRQKPYQTRIKILWTTTAVAGLLVLAVWGVSLKSEINKLDGQKLLPEINAQQENDKKFVEVERVESSGNAFNIFFRVKNDTNDILNFSRAEEVTLQARGTEISPNQISDRQNKQFVQKILSHTENFGVLVFPPLNSDSAELTFKDLYFEKSPETIFKEVLELDLDELKKDQTLRE